MNVLVVEDNAGHAALVRELLDAAAPGAFACTLANTLGDAVEHLLAGATDCVLLDLELPDATGIEALERIRGAAMDVPVLVLSAHDADEIALAALRAGAQDFLVKGALDGRTLARALRHAVERKRIERRLAHQALHDELTGLPNRTLFGDRLRLALSRLDRTEACLAVMLLDVDGFKAVNDERGHAEGDRVLREVADALVAGLRGGDTAARWGGDEFVMLCDDVAGPAEARRIGVRVLRGLPLAASLGVALTDDRDADPEELLRTADAAMYEVKRRGGADLEIAG
jgi:diguanylate cyclase (GGDEF)-like protein